MPETVPKRNIGLRYLIWGMVFVVVFGVSVYAGYRLMGPKKLSAPSAPSGLKFSELPMVTPTIGHAKPVTVAVVSELDEIKLEEQVDSAVLDQWWVIIGVDSQALPLKELGGYNWYTPTRLKIMLKDISPLSKEERWRLYKPTASGPEAEPVAGLATVIDAASPDEIEYQAYVLPEVLVDGRAVEEIEESVNRQVFEVLYEGAVGSTAMTPDDYQRKRDSIFDNWQGQGVVELSAKKPQTLNGTADIHKILSVEDSLQDDMWGRLAGVVTGQIERMQDWRLVGQAYAQTCGGNWKCGANWKECKCSNSGAACLESEDGKPCGSVQGTCNCNTICVQNEGALNSCDASYGQCKPPGTNGNCSQCLAVNTCGWSGSNPTPTTPASCGNGTCGSGESCSNCPADCGVCTEVTWAYITVTVYGDNGLQAPSNRTKEPSSGSDTCKGYEFASSSTGTSWDAYGNCQNSWLLDMAKTDKSMNISGIDSKYSDCQVKLNNTVIDSSFANGKCSVPSRTYNQYNDSLVITLLKARPNADFTAGPVNNSKIGYGLNYQWTNSATDANGNMKSWGIYVRETGGSFTPIGWSSNNSGVASATLTSNTWTCSKKNQEYEVAVNAKEGDPPLLECSGGSANAYNKTSAQAQTRCVSGDDLRKVTCVVPSCTFTAAPTNVSTGAAGAFSASSNNAELIQMQYRLKGTETCSRWQAHHSSTRPSIQTTGRLESPTGLTAQVELSILG